MEENIIQENISERKYDFQSLSERITVQTEAYIGFSNALVKIIEQTANNRDLSIQIKELLEEEYKELNDGFQSILLEITKYHGDETNNNNLLNKDIEILKSKLTQVETRIEILIKDNSIHQEDNTKKTLEVNNYSKQIISKIDEFKNENKIANDTILQYVNNQNKNLMAIQDTYKKIKYFIWAVGIIVTGYTILSNLHILSLTWFGSSSK